MNEAMICPGCHHKNREGNCFCTQCGVLLTEQTLCRGHLIIVSEQGFSEQPRRREVAGSSRPERRKGVEIGLLPFILGRNQDSAIILDDVQVSAHHAKITSDGQQFWIEDLTSTNGTYVDGICIQTRTPLRPESLIRIGSTIMKFEVRSTRTNG